MADYSPILELHSLLIAEECDYQAHTHAHFLTVRLSDDFSIIDVSFKPKVPSTRIQVRRRSLLLYAKIVLYLMINLFSDYLFLSLLKEFAFDLLCLISSR